ncbi:MAG TPA: phage holin family protein [Polyangia bacterium]
MKNGERDKADGVVGLARETADALGRLTIQHLRLARLEIKADLRAMGLQAGLIAVLAALATVGYGLTMAGLAAMLGGAVAVGTPLLILGIVHVVGAGAGILIAVSRLRRMRLMNATAGEVNQSLAPLGIGATAKPMSARTGADR